LADNAHSAGSEESRLLESAGLGWVQNLRLDAALPCPTGHGLIASDHAVQRYRERIEHVSEPLARQRIAQLCAGATFRPQPPTWHDGVLRPGTCYGTVAGLPDVCLVAAGRVVLTVITRRSVQLTRELRLRVEGIDGT
jgi:hypothetical protein